MSNETRDPERIWLEPGMGAPETGRLWCDTDVWAGDPDYEEDGPSTEYVRADLARLDAADPLRAMWSELVEALEDEGPNPRHHRQTMARHRVEWPVLWKALDRLRTRALDTTNQGGDDAES